MTQDEVYQWINANRNLLSQEELMGISRQGGGGDDGGYTPWDYGDIQQKAINPALLRKYGLPATLGGNQELREINGQLYTAVHSGSEPGWGLPGKGYLSAENFFNDATPELAAQRQDALSKMVEQDGRQWIPIQNYASAQKSMEPFNNKKSGFDNFLESLFSAGPLIASSALAGGALSGFNGLSPSIWESLGIQNPFSGLSNLLNSGGGSGGTTGLDAFYQAAGYSPAEIASLQSSLSGLGGSFGGGFEFGGGGDSQLANGLDPITTGEAVQPFSTNPSLADLGGAVSGASSNNALMQLLQKAQPSLLTSLLGSGIQGISSLIASNAQKNAANQANSTLANQYAQNRADLAPYREAGYGALDKLVGMTTPGRQFTTMQADPGYQFRYQQGEDALNNRLKAGGKFYSGSALKGGQEYAQGFASNEFGNVYNRLAGLAGTGQTATTNTAQMGTNTANQIANNEADMGNARASGYVGLGNAVQGGINAYNNQNMQNALLQLLAGNRNAFGSA